MTHKSTWKKREAQVARAFGSERTPLSGRNSKRTASDSLHDKYFIETKMRACHSILRVWDKANMLAKEENKIPMVCLVEKQKPSFWLLLKFEDFLQIVEREANALQTPAESE